MGFHFGGSAKISHLNVRKEGPEDDKIIALDIKFTAKAHGDILLAFDSSLRQFAFREDGQPRFPMLAALQVAGEMLHHVIQFNDMEFNDVKLSKFTLMPQQKDKVELSFLASFKPTAREVAIISESLQEEILIDIAPQPELPFDMPEVVNVF